MKLDKLKYVSTKTGDKGTSSNYSNERFRKSNVLFEVLGTIDELSSFLGMTYHFTKYEDIKNIQKNLQKIMAIIATSPDAKNYQNLEKLNIDEISKIESTMQGLLNEKPLEPKFYLPGSEKSKKGSYFDVCRAITRRAERRIDEFIIEHNRTDLEEVRSYMNRLSDYLFLLSCNM